MHSSTYRSALTLVAGIVIGAFAGSWLARWSEFAEVPPGYASGYASTAGYACMQPRPANLASLAGGDPKIASGERRRYYVAESTVPGAGMGVFAAEDLPANTVWNVDDRAPGHMLVVTSKQWETLVSTLEYLESRGYNNTGLHRLHEAIRTYSYFCKGLDSAFLSLTLSGFTNHARVSSSTDGADSSTVSSPSTRASLRRHALATDVSTGNPQTANSDDLEDSPDAYTRCTLSRVTRDVRQGEEILEDYRTFHVPYERELNMPLRHRH